MAYPPWNWPGICAPYHRHTQYSYEPYEKHARWIHGMGPCCEWCESWKVYFRDIVFGISPFHPFGFGFQIDPIFDDIWDMYEQIHTHYRHGLVTSPMDSYTISTEIEYLSKLMWQAFRLYPHFSKLQKLSSYLKDMAIEIQIGPRRRPYYTLPKQRFLEL